MEEANAQMDIHRDYQSLAESQRGRSPLYNHALESICVWLSLEELAIVMTTCKRLYHIVGVTMKRIDASIETKMSLRLEQDAHPTKHRHIAGPLTRHVAHVKMKFGRCAFASILFDTFPYLQSFRGPLNVFSVVTPIQFRASITSINFRLGGSGGTEASTRLANSILRALSTLPRLRRITMHLSVYGDFLSVAPLCVMTSLEDLAIAIPQTNLPHRFLDELRALSWLKQVRVSCLDQDVEAVDYLFRIPHDLQWESCLIASVYKTTQATLRVMQSLRHLTTVEIEGVSMRVDLGARNDGHSIHSSQLAEALHAMSTRLTSLKLMSSYIASADMIRILSIDTYQLTYLGLIAIDTWDSFDCFTTGPLTRTLTTLNLVRCRDIRASELPKLACLRALRTLQIVMMLTDEDMCVFHVPSTMIPTLTRFVG